MNVLASNFFYLAIKGCRRLDFYLTRLVTLGMVKILFSAFQIKAGRHLNSRGIPYINVFKGGKIVIGDHFTMNNGFKGNIIGRQQRCIFIVHPSAVLNIGHNVGISSTAMVCWKKIQIGNNVRIGGNVIIYDTDFHSLTPQERSSIQEDKSKINTAAVVIEDDVFIGAHSIILKGVHIGKGAVIGAGSLVARDIPAGEIWAGNPAKFIKKCF